MFRFSLFLSLFLAIGCSDDPTPAENNATNNQSNNPTNNPSNNQSNNSTTPTNNSTNNNNVLPGDVRETEPNNELDQATRVAVGQSFAGNIAAGSGQNADIDIFVLSLEGGTILELEFADFAQNLQPEIEFFDEDGLVIRYLNPSTSTKRQVFIPVDGDYYVAVYDIRAEQQHGGDSATYLVQTRIAEPTPIDLDSPASVTGNTSDGNVDVYRVVADTSDVLVFETFGMRSPGQGDIDTVLIAYSPEAGLIDFNDDIDVDDGNYDSMVVFRPEAGLTYLVVVDMWEVLPTNGYTLVSTTTDDNLMAPSPISIGGTFDGVIEDRGDDFDTDFFVVELSAGEVGRFEVESTGDMIPTISVYIDTIFGFFSIADALPVSGIAAVEFGNTIEEAGTFYILVDDLRNAPFEGEAENVGGESFTYTARLNLVEWEPVATAIPGDVLGSVALGTYAWYATVIPANSVLVANVVTGASDFEPVLATYEAGVDESLGEPLAPFFNFAQTTRQLAVGARDIYFRGGAAYDFTLSFSVISIEDILFVEVAEEEPNDTSQTAQSLTLPVALKGATQGTASDSVNEDWFSIELIAGDRVLAYTGPGSDVSANADTILAVYGPNGTSLLSENDDYEGQVDTYFSGLVFVAPADGTYFVKVIPYCSSNSCDNGEYTLYLAN